MNMGIEKLNQADRDWLASQERIEQAWNERFLELFHKGQDLNTEGLGGCITPAFHEAECRRRVIKEFGGYQPYKHRK